MRACTASRWRWQGFKESVRDDIERRVSDRMTLDFTMEPGNVAESVIVTGETPLLETATASVIVMDGCRGDSSEVTVDGICHELVSSTRIKMLFERVCTGHEGC